MNHLHLLVCLILFQDFLSLLYFDVFVGHLLSDHVDVSEGFARVEQHKLILSVGWKEHLIGLNHELQLDFFIVVEVQPRFFQQLHFKREDVEIDLSLRGRED